MPDHPPRFYLIEGVTIDTVPNHDPQVVEIFENLKTENSEHNTLPYAFASDIDWTYPNIIGKSFFDKISILVKASFLVKIRFLIKILTFYENFDFAEILKLQKNNHLSEFRYLGKFRCLTKFRFLFKLLSSARNIDFCPKYRFGQFFGKFLPIFDL